MTRQFGSAPRSKRSRSGIFNALEDLLRGNSRCLLFNSSTLQSCRRRIFAGWQSPLGPRNPITPWVEGTAISHTRFPSSLTLLMDLSIILQSRPCFCTPNCSLQGPKQGLVSCFYLIRGTSSFGMSFSLGGRISWIYHNAYLRA